MSMRMGDLAKRKDPEEPVKKQHPNAPASQTAGASDSWERED